MEIAQIEAGQLSLAVRNALIWTQACDLYRFHGKAQGLHLCISRPCSNQYYCLNVYSQRTKRLLHWNFGGLSVLTDAEGGDEPVFLRGSAPGTYLSIGLSEGSRRLLEEAERVLELAPRPAQPEKTNPTALCFRAIAAVMRQRVFWGHEAKVVLADSATSWDSVAGYVDKHFPAIVARVSELRKTGPYADAARYAERVWQLQAGEVAVTLDVATAQAVGSTGERVDLWHLFESRGRDLWAVVGWLEKQLGG